MDLLNIVKITFQNSFYYVIMVEREAQKNAVKK